MVEKVISCIFTICATVIDNYHKQNVLCKSIIYYTYKTQKRSQHKIYNEFYGFDL